MAALGEHGRESFARRMALFLREQLSEETAGHDDQALLDLARREMARASGYGVVSERGVCTFLSLAAMYGEGFEELRPNSWMKDYLTDPAVPDPDQRMHRLYQAVIKRLEKEAEQQQILAEFNSQGGGHGQ